MIAISPLSPAKHMSRLTSLQALVKNTTSNVVLIREDPKSTKPISTFDYNDLNAYVLVVVGLGHPPEELVGVYDDIAKRAQARDSIPLRDIQPICRKETLVTVSYTHLTLPTN